MDFHEEKLLLQQELDLFKDILVNKKDYYHQYIVKKRRADGSIKRRLITNPKVNEEKYYSLQKKIIEAMQEDNVFMIHSSSYAWLKGKNRESCADIHIGNKYIMEIDITDYFGNVTREHLISLFNRTFNNSRGLSNEDLADFFTAPHLLEDNKPHLAQGFASSPYLANAVRYELDCKISEFCDRLQLTYSNYGDNFIISGNTIKAPIKFSIWNMLNEFGFTLDPKKIKITSSNKRQEILGIVVNSKRSISKIYCKNVIGELIAVLKEEGELTPSLRGKVNVLSLAENKKRYYDYAIKLMEKIIGKRRITDTRED